MNHGQQCSMGYFIDQDKRQEKQETLGNRALVRFVSGFFFGYFSCF